LTRLGTALVASAVALSAYAWHVQSGAANMFAEARALQARTRSDGASGIGPELRDYRAVLATLERSIEIRRAIDGLLARAEAAVASFDAARAASQDIAVSATEELDALGAELSAAVGAARAGGAALGPLERRLARAARLMALIAAELKELDRSLGPTLGERP
jgi:hypothetical protein